MHPIAQGKLVFHGEAETRIQQGALSTHKWSLWHRTGSISDKISPPW